MKGRYQKVDVHGQALQEFLGLLAQTRLNGSTHVRRFKWTGDEDQWFRMATNLQANESFRTLLESDAVREALPEVVGASPFPYGSPPPFVPIRGGALRLDGEFATLLVNGGAYERYRGAQSAAKEIARRAVVDLTDERYEDFEVFYTDAPWSPWFFDVAWDETWILVDRRYMQVTLICTTDTD